MSVRAQREAIKRQEEQEERQREHQSEQQVINQAFNQKGELDRGWMQDIIDDDMEEKLQKFTLNKIKETLTKEVVLSNRTDAETHDRYWELEVLKYKIFGQHPPQESAIQGPLRAFLFDDETEGVWALTSEERTAIAQIISALQDRVTRGRGGFERKQMNTSYAAAIREEREEETRNGSRLRGLF